MRWTRQCRAQTGLQGGIFRERSTGARTDGAANCLLRNWPDGTRSGKTFGEAGADGGRGGVLAPNAGVKFCGDVSPRPGPDASVIRRATVAKELGSPRRARSKP